HYIYECELPVEAADSGVSLAGLFSRFDREANRRCVGELETYNGMGHPRRPPIIDREVDAGDMRNARGTRLPARRVIRLGAVVAVAAVVQRNLVAVNLRPRELGHIGLPVAVVARLDREPHASTTAKPATMIPIARPRPLTKISAA